MKDGRTDSSAREAPTSISESAISPVDELNQYPGWLSTVGGCQTWCIR